MYVRTHLWLKGLIPNIYEQDKNKLKPKWKCLCNNILSYRNRFMKEKNILEYLKLTLLGRKNGKYSWLSETIFYQIGTSFGLEKSIFTDL